MDEEELLTIRDLTLHAELHGGQMHFEDTDGQEWFIVKIINGTHEH